MPVDGGVFGEACFSGKNEDDDRLIGELLLFGNDAGEYVGVEVAVGDAIYIDCCLFAAGDLLIFSKSHLYDFA